MYSTGEFVQFSILEGERRGRKLCWFHTLKRDLDFRASIAYMVIPRDVSCSRGIKARREDLISYLMFCDISDIFL